MALGASGNVEVVPIGQCLLRASDCAGGRRRHRMSGSSDFRGISKGGGAHSGARGWRTHLELLAGEVVTEETRLARRAAVVGWCCCRCPPPAAPRRRQ